MSFKEWTEHKQYQEWRKEIASQEAVTSFDASVKCESETVTVNSFSSSTFVVDWKA